MTSQASQRHETKQETAAPVGRSDEGLRTAADQLALAAFVTERELQSFRRHLAAETPPFIRAGCLEELDHLEQKWREWKARPIAVRFLVGLFGGLKLPPPVHSGAPRFSDEQVTQLRAWKRSWTEALQIWVDAPLNTDYENRVDFLSGISDTRVRAFVALLFLQGHPWPHRAMRESTLERTGGKPDVPLRGVSRPHAQVYELWIRIVCGRLERLAAEVTRLNLRANERSVNHGKGLIRLRRIERKIWQRLYALRVALEVETQAYAFGSDVQELLAEVNNWLSEPLSAFQLAALCSDCLNALDVFLLQIRLKVFKGDEGHDGPAGGEPAHPGVGAGQADLVGHSQTVVWGQMPLTALGISSDGVFGVGTLSSGKTERRLSQKRNKNGITGPDL